MHVKVVGCHCHKCRTLKHHVRVLARQHGWKVTMDVINDPATIHVHGDLEAPALFINDELVSAGRALTAQEIEDHWVNRHD